MERKKVAGLHVPDPAKVEIKALNRAKYNPNRMTREEMEGLKASIKKFGLALNFVVQKRGMVMIGGHQRLTAVEELCREESWEIPTHGWATVYDVDDATAKKMNVALNRHHGSMDPVSLGELFLSIDVDKLLEDDYRAIGFSEEQVAETIRAALPPEQQAAELERQAAEIGLAGVDRAYSLTIEFKSAEMRDEAKSGLAYAAKKLGKCPGVLVTEALKRQFSDHFKEAKREARQKAKGEPAAG